MVLRLFGLKKKGEKPAASDNPPAAPRSAGAPATAEPVEFEETGGAPAAASAKTVTVRTGGGKPSGRKGASRPKASKSAAKKAPKKAGARKTNQGKRTSSKKK